MLQGVPESRRELATEGQNGSVCSWKLKSSEASQLETFPQDGFNQACARVRGVPSPPGHQTASTWGHWSTWPRPQPLGLQVISIDPLPLGSLEMLVSDTLAQGSASPVSSQSGFKPRGTWTGGDWTPGSSLCRESWGQGLYLEPCPPPRKRHSPGGEFRGSSCHQNLRAPWRGLCTPWALRVPVCPGGGTRPVHCTCAQDVARQMCTARAPCIPGGRGRCSKTSELSGIFPNR